MKTNIIAPGKVFRNNKGETFRVESLHSSLRERFWFCTNLNTGDRYNLFEENYIKNRLIK